MASLSPAAQQVFWEFNRAASGKPDDWHYLPAIAAALRAAADQVVPEQAIEDVPGRFVNGCCHARLQDTRAELLAIAAKLEQAASNTTETTP
jgi:hypothetical protein